MLETNVILSFILRGAGSELKVRGAGARAGQAPTRGRHFDEMFLLQQNVHNSPHQVQDNKTVQELSISLCFFIFLT